MPVDIILYHVAVLGISLLLAQSLNEVWKAGMFSFGHHGFAAIGAYTAAGFLIIILGRTPVWEMKSLQNRLDGLILTLLSITIAMVITGLVGWVSYHLFHRLKGDYLAVGTLVLAEITLNILSNLRITGGGLGFEIPYLFVQNTFVEKRWYLLIFSTAIVSLNIFLFYFYSALERSVLGAQIVGILSDETTAKAIGIDVKQVQALAFAAAAAVAGAAGGIFLHFMTIVTPSDFSFLNGLPIILYVVVGGYNSSRCVAATIIIYSLYELIKLRFLGLFGDSLGQLLFIWKEGAYAFIILGYIASQPYLDALKRLCNRWLRPTEES